MASFMVRVIWLCTRVFAADLLRFFIGAEPLKGWMTDLAVARPLGEDDLADQPRLHPVRMATEPSRRRRIERRRILFDCFEPPFQVECDRMRESGPHLSREDQLRAIVVADEQRADADAAP